MSIFVRISCLVLLFLGAGIVWAKRDKVPRPPGTVTGHEVSGRTTDPTPVEFNLDGHIFQVPRNYLWIKNQWRGLSGEGTPARQVFMEATLDGLAPYTNETSNMFRNKGKPLRILDIQFNAAKNNVVYGEEFLEFGDYSDCVDRRLGFRFCYKGQGGYEGLKWGAALINDHLAKNEIYMWCEVERPNTSPLFSFCFMHFRYMPHVNVKVRIEKSHISKVPKIYEGVRARLDGFYDGFRQSAPRQ